MKKLIFIALFALPFLNGCYYDNFNEIHPIVSDTCIIADTVSFSNDIQPIMNQSCGTSNSACHLSNASTGLGLANYTLVIGNIQDATVASFLSRIKHDNGVSPAKWMPKDGIKISDCDISKIEKWIAQGQLNN